ncbi:MAG: excalibur calcium-binding domain-containing protein [Nakamurella sp.]
MVALGDAWRSGAAGWTAEHRRDFANDPANLTAVGASVNESKGDSSAASWLPPNKIDRCGYVSQQIEVKKSYLLTVTPAEREVIARLLVGCGGVAPTSQVRTAPSTPTAPTALTTTAPPKPSTPPTTTHPTVAPTTSIRPLVSVPSAPPTSKAPSDVYYKNCTAARQAGAAPLHRGEPGYRSGLDRDDDGIACENG